VASAGRRGRLAVDVEREAARGRVLVLVMILVVRPTIEGIRLKRKAGQNERERARTSLLTFNNRDSG
jgi:hypothetical protein